MKVHNVMWNQAREEGQGMVLFTMVLVVLLALAGLVLDGGFVLAYRRQAQNAADAAALAAAHELALAKNDNVILSRVEEYAIDYNGATSVIARYHPGGEVVGPPGSIPAETDGVVVTTTIEFPTVFAGIIGQDRLSVSASAKSSCGTIQSAYPLAPMAVFELCDESEPGCPPGGGFVLDTEYPLWGDKTGPGGFGWLDWDGNNVGDVDLAENLLNMENSINPVTGGHWEVGELVPTGPGVMNSSDVTAALDWWLARPENERQWTVPVYDYIDGSGSNLKYHISAFGRFILTGYNFQGSDKYITGRFVGQIVPSSDVNLTNCRELSIYSILLTR